MPHTYVKTRPDAPAGFFAAEAAGLRWLSVPDGVPVAGVHAVARTSLTIDRVPTGSPTLAAAEEFGRRLAATHDAGATFFGIGPDGGPGVGWIGDAALPLRTVAPASWGAWYAEDRLLFHATEQTSPTRRWTGWSSGWHRGISTTTRHRRGSTATCGRGTCCGRPRVWC